MEDNILENITNNSFPCVAVRMRQTKNSSYLSYEKWYSTAA